nr:putative transporter c22e12.01 [Quercus suber]
MSLEKNAAAQAQGKSSSRYAEAGDERGRSSADERRMHDDSDASDMDLDELLDSDHEGGDDDDEETGLTHAERKRRRRRRRQDASLEAQFDGGRREANQDYGEERGEPAEEGPATAGLWRSIMINAVLIALWYSFSISISVYNKWMFSKENLDFHFPLFTTSLHMVIQFSLAATVLYFRPALRPVRSQAPGQGHGAQQYTSLDPTQPAQPPPMMTRWFYLTRISPCSTATALDIGLGNFSLRFISLTFFTMCKSSVLAFVLLFAFVFRLEQPTWRLCLIIAFMTSGVIMMVAGEAAFNALGFILVITASFCSGLRWSLTQILLLRNPATSNPFSSIFFLTPVMFLALIVLALPIEGPRNLAAGFSTLSSEKGLLLSITILLFPGVLAFLMVAAEFALLKRTSVVTLSVCGIFKEVLTISAAGIAFGDELSPINISGLFVTIASIAAYNYLKYYNMSKQPRNKTPDSLRDDIGMKPLSNGGQDVLARHDDEAIGRESTSALMRDSVTIVTERSNVLNKLEASDLHGSSSSSSRRRSSELK